MTQELIQVYGRVNEKGQLELTDQLTLPIGDEVLVTIERVAPEMLAEEDAMWDKLFDRAPEHLAKLVEQARKSIADGTATVFDPDLDEV